MQFLSKHEFSVLSEVEKSDYYNELIELKNRAVTALQLDGLKIEFAKLDYKDSADIAKELDMLAEKQRCADDEFAMGKRKKGFLIGLLIVLAALGAAAIIGVVSMFI